MVLTTAPLHSASKLRNPFYVKAAVDTAEKLFAGDCSDKATQRGISDLLAAYASLRTQISDTPQLCSSGL